MTAALDVVARLTATVDLWYPTASGLRCEDCSLWTQEERAARYASMSEPAG